MGNNFDWMILRENFDWSVINEFFHFLRMKKLKHLSDTRESSFSSFIDLGDIQSPKRISSQEMDESGNYSHPSPPPAGKKSVSKFIYTQPSTESTKRLKELLAPLKNSNFAFL
jgi:hypothetical protein